MLDTYTELMVLVDQQGGSVMKIFAINALGSALLLAALGGALGAAQAAVEVRFVNPDAFVDANRDEDMKKQALDGLQQHLQALGAKLAPSQTLAIEVLDVNLAGEDRPVPSRGTTLRILRSGTPPSLQLRYTLSEGGAVLRSGDARVNDLGYQNRLNRYHSDDALRYEKAMLDNWFAEEFGVGKVAAKAK
jgi:hypothetical protein